MKKPPEQHTVGDERIPLGSISRAERPDGRMEKKMKENLRLVGPVHRNRDELRNALLLDDPTLEDY